MVIKQPLGSQLHLYRLASRPPARKLLITAHGQYYTDKATRIHLPGEETTVPLGTTLVFYSRHGEPAIYGGIPGQLKSHIIPRERVGPGQRVWNYRLFKFEHRENEVETALKETTGCEFDVLALRNRWSNRYQGTSLSDVFAACRARGLGYAEIHCSFCRSHWLADD
jgi:hypothetical protein